MVSVYTVASAQHWCLSTLSRVPSSRVYTVVRPSTRVSSSGVYIVASAQLWCLHCQIIVVNPPAVNDLKGKLAIKYIPFWTDHSSKFITDKDNFIFCNGHNRKILRLYPKVYLLYIAVNWYIELYSICTYSTIQIFSLVKYFCFLTIFFQVNIFFFF